MIYPTNLSFPRSAICSSIGPSFVIDEESKSNECREMKPLIFLLPILLIGSHVCANRPNILFIFSDDHAYQAISAYGSNRNKTPNLDRIAKEGMRFDRAFVTNSICAPSRAVVLTGKHSHLNGQLTNGETFDGSQQTFPKLLQKRVIRPRSLANGT
jgi:hypothetical protein